MSKSLSYYLSLPYTRELIKEESGVWFARIKELPGCMSQGDSPEEALVMLEDAMVGWLETEIEDGEDIPEPRDIEDYSGKFLLRVSKSLHKDISDAADYEGVSLNQWVSTKLAEAVGFRSSSKNIPPLSDDDDSWPGLKGVYREILTAHGFNEVAESLDEKLFSRWLKMNLQQIRILCLQGIYTQALEENEALLMALEGFRDRSVIIASFIDILIMQSNLIQEQVALKQRNMMLSEKESASQQEISKILQLVLDQQLSPPSRSYSVGEQEISWISSRQVDANLQSSETRLSEFVKHVQVK